MKRKSPTPSRHREPYPDDELRTILSHPPTWENVTRFATELERTESAIKLIYDVAATRRSHLNEEMSAKAFWKQIRRVAADLGWTTVPRSARTKGDRCPSCGSKNVLSIAYGYPGPEMQEAARRGEIELGGCMVDDANPVFRCRDCGHGFGRWGTADRRAR